MKYGLVLGLVLCVSGTARAGNQKKLVIYSNLPVSVQNAATKAMPDTVWSIAVQCPDGWYAIAGRDKANHHVEYRYDPDSKKAYYRTVVSPSEVPVAVMSALEARYPLFHLKRVQTVGYNSRNVLGYRFEGTGLEPANNCAYVSANAKKVLQTKD